MTSKLQLNTDAPDSVKQLRGGRSVRTKGAAVATTGLKAALALDKACGALNAYIRACVDADLPYKGADDGRTLLVGNMSEFASYLNSVYDKGIAA